MRFIRKSILLLLSLPIVYLLVSITLSLITVNNYQKNQSKNLDQCIYLHTNGVHLDIAIPTQLISTAVTKDLKYSINDNYLSFGWGDKNFYINTPTWSDLTFKVGFEALFLKSTTLMHVTRYKNTQKDWVKIPVSSIQLQKINNFVLNSFSLTTERNKTILPNKGYSNTDDFYKANGSYSCFYTCNSWANNALKTSDLKASFWTPFDFIVLNKYN